MMTHSGIRTQTRTFLYHTPSSPNATPPLKHFWGREALPPPPPPPRPGGAGPPPPPPHGSPARAACDRHTRGTMVAALRSLCRQGPAPRSDPFYILMFLLSGRTRNPEADPPPFSMASGGGGGATLVLLCT